MGFFKTLKRAAKAMVDTSHSVEVMEGENAVRVAFNTVERTNFMLTSSSLARHRTTSLEAIDVSVVTSSDSVSSASSSNSTSTPTASTTPANCTVTSSAAAIPSLTIAPSFPIERSTAATSDPSVVAPIASSTPSPKGLRKVHQALYREGGKIIAGPKTHATRQFEIIHGGPVHLAAPTPKHTLSRVNTRISKPRDVPSPIVTADIIISPPLSSTSTARPPYTPPTSLGTSPSTGAAEAAPSDNQLAHPAQPIHPDHALLPLFQHAPKKTVTSFDGTRIILTRTLDQVVAQASKERRVQASGVKKGDRGAYGVSSPGPAVTRRVRGGRGSAQLFVESTEVEERDQSAPKTNGQSKKVAFTVSPNPRNQSTKQGSSSHSAGITPFKPASSRRTSSGARRVLPRPTAHTAHTTSSTPARETTGVLFGRGIRTIPAGLSSLSEEERTSLGRAFRRTDPAFYVHPSPLLSASQACLAERVLHPAASPPASSSPAPSAASHAPSTASTAPPASPTGAAYRAWMAVRAYRPDSETLHAASCVLSKCYLSHFVGMTRCFLERSDAEEEHEGEDREAVGKRMKRRVVLLATVEEEKEGEGTGDEEETADDTPSCDELFMELFGMVGEQGANMRGQLQVVVEEGEEAEVFEKVKKDEIVLEEGEEKGEEELSIDSFLAELEAQGLRAWKGKGREVVSRK
ncbi:hypothetical protein IAT38_002460 [Cryptococcus sp. DSM 104549]